MRIGYRTALGMVAAALWVWQAAGPAIADIVSDRAAAILVFPKVVSDRVEIRSELADEIATTDTIIQISNVSDEPVALRCFYVNGNHHCSASGLVCDPNSPAPCPDAADFCIPRWVETDFEVFVTARQPLAWRASAGFSGDDLPLGAAFQRGPTGESNAGTHVPPVGAEPFFSAAAQGSGLEVAASSFVGELKCVVVDENRRAVPRNVIKGEATIVTSVGLGNSLGDDFTVPGVEKYNAIGIQAINGDANGDNHLELGGGTNEYNGCPSVLIADHFFDFADDPAGSDTVGDSFAGPVFSELTLVSCTEDFRNQVPGGAVAQFLVFNEFEQRFSTSVPMQCALDRPLSRIDTRDPTRSIFSVYVAGTLTGQTRIRAVRNGFVGMLREKRGPALAERVPSPPAAVNIHHQGERSEQDRIGIP